jgi:hypothetical protein
LDRKKVENIRRHIHSDNAGVVSEILAFRLRRKGADDLEMLQKTTKTAPELLPESSHDQRLL